MSDDDDGGWQWAPDDEDDEAAGDTKGDGGITAVPGKDAVVYLVDCQDSMLEEGDDGNTFTRSIQLITKALYEQMIARPSDLVGIVFYGTQHNSNSNDHEHIYEFRDLGTPDVHLIRMLEAIVENPDDFEERIGHGDTATVEDSYGTSALLKYALSTAQLMISQVRIKVASRRVIIFTAVDDPYPDAGDAHKKRQNAISQARDVRDKGIAIGVMPLSNTAFDSTLFYNEITSDQSDNGGIPVDETAILQDQDALLRRLQSKVQRHRPLMKIPFTIGPGNLTIGVRMYKLYRHATKGVYVNVRNREDLGYPRVESKTVHTYADGTGQPMPLRPDEVHRTVSYGGENVTFTKRELEGAKFFAAPGMTLLGFKPRHRLKRHSNVKNGLFVYPDESVVKGSTTVFCALRASCRKRGVFALCRLIGSRSMAPRFVALYPTDEEDDSPVGFHLTYLPYTDDMRKLPYDRDDGVHASPSQVDTMRGLIQSLTSSTFDARKYKNPALERHFRAIESGAFDRLSEAAIATVVDYTDVPISTVDERAGDIVSECVATFFPHGTATAVDNKRKARDDGGGAARAKKAKEDVKPLTPALVKSLIETNKLKSRTVAELKEFLVGQGIKPVGTKPKLLDAIAAQFS
eukprot:m.325381 g.325381  ORF g.325381 m.325381 type:complete len:632 (+) comp20384_c0_seq5:53-1948(+)